MRFFLKSILISLILFLVACSNSDGPSKSSEPTSDIFKCNISGNLDTSINTSNFSIIFSGNSDKMVVDVNFIYQKAYCYIDLAFPKNAAEGQTYSINSNDTNSPAECVLDYIEGATKHDTYELNTNGSVAIYKCNYNNEKGKAWWGIFNFTAYSKQNPTKKIVVKDGEFYKIGDK